MTVLLLPVFQPGPHLLTMIGEARAALPGVRVVVVDDGSGALPVLDSAEALGCTVLRHGTNLGKGVALKTGLRHVEGEGADVLCADADGQHEIDDVVRVAERLRETRHIVLGVRDVGPQMPLRSRFGNAVTMALFRAATGEPVRDTQTGLRGYPGHLLSWLLGVPGERFEYEMNVLLEAVRTGRPIEQVDIATKYLNGNASSHFGVLADAVRIYRPLVQRAVARPFA
jgi:glycosyltransferase involved in cell wall biosynthesis